MSVLPEELAVGSGALEVGYIAVHLPNDQPIASIGDVAFVSSGPLSGKAMHVVSLFKRCN